MVKRFRTVVFYNVVTLYFLSRLLRWCCTYTYVLVALLLLLESMMCCLIRVVEIVWIQVCCVCCACFQMFQYVLVPCLPTYTCIILSSQRFDSRSIYKFPYLQNTAKGTNFAFVFKIVKEVHGMYLCIVSGWFQSVWRFVNKKIKEI